MPKYLFSLVCFLSCLTLISLGPLRGQSDQKPKDSKSEQWKRHIRNTSMNPPEVPCNIREKDIDPFTGKSRVILESVPFFNHTPEQLNGQLTQRSFIEGRVSVARLEETIYLLLEIDVATQKTEETFGGLPEGGILKVKMISGETITMVAARSNRALSDGETKRTVYTAYYPITRSKREALLANEVDLIRVVWDKGYEDYDIYYMDALIDLLNCMENKGL